MRSIFTISQRITAIVTRALLGFILLLIPMASAEARMTVSPVIINLEATPGASAQLLITNQSDAILPIDISIMRMTVDRDGKVMETPDDGALLVFPPQATVAGKKSQVFRVQYVGGPLAAGVSYFVYIKQLPIEMAEGESGVQVLYTFKALTNVIPVGAQAQLSVSADAIIKGADGSNHVRILVRNVGASQAMLSDLRMRLVQQDSVGNVIFDKTLAPSDVAKSIGIGLVPSGGERLFEIIEALPSASGPVSVELSSAK